jgi:hypothetical protein
MTILGTSPHGYSVTTTECPPADTDASLHQWRRPALRDNHRARGGGHSRVPTATARPPDATKSPPILQGLAGGGVHPAPASVQRPAGGRRHPGGLPVRPGRECRRSLARPYQWTTATPCERTSGSVSSSSSPATCSRTGCRIPSALMSQRLRVSASFEVGLRGTYRNAGRCRRILKLTPLRPWNLPGDTGAFSNRRRQIGAACGC